MIKNNNEGYVKKGHKNKNNILSRKNVTLAAILTILQACNSNYKEDIGFNFVREGDDIYLDYSKYNGDGKVLKEHKREVNVADPKTFKLIDYYFGKDNINVYYLSQESPDLKILEGADPETFRKDSKDTEIGSINNHYYIDKNHTYMFTH